MNTDTVRLMFMAIATNVVTVLVLGDLVAWSAELTAAIMAVINSTALMVAYIVKPTSP